MTANQKDRWDKASVLLKAAVGLFTAVAIAAIGFFSSSYLERQQRVEMRTRLYTELISKREEAESALRKDMFKSIIDSFLKPGSASVDAQILQLELLALNFHESLSLKPLFKHFEKQIKNAGNFGYGEKEEFLNRLHKVAREISRKQIAVLEAAGDAFDTRIDFRDFIQKKRARRLEDFTLVTDTATRDFSLTLLDIDTTMKELKVRLEIRAPNNPDNQMEAKFWVGFFDFPMIDNTRLSDDQRCAVVLKKFEGLNAELSVLCFPGSHASLREKPYYQEVVNKLLAEDDRD
jgi:hypothetical protein